MGQNDTLATVTVIPQTYPLWAALGSRPAGTSFAGRILAWRVSEEQDCPPYPIVEDHGICVPWHDIDAAAAELPLASICWATFDSPAEAEAEAKREGGVRAGAGAR